jgi:hypothetical protein
MGPERSFNLMFRTAWDDEEQWGMCIRCTPPLSLAGFLVNIRTKVETLPRAVLFLTLDILWRLRHHYVIPRAGHVIDAVQHAAGAGDEVFSAAQRAVGERSIYLRPETAQGTFVQYRAAVEGAWGGPGGGGDHCDDAGNNAMRLGWWFWPVAKPIIQWIG